MENASKALLIAGAILIAILLIAIGMMVFNSASGVIDTASSGMTDHEKTMHNKKFTLYEGKKSGSVVKDLLEEINVNNSNTENQKVWMTASETYVKGTGTTGYSVKDGFNVQAQYNISFKKNENGVITGCQISE